MLIARTIHAGNCRKRAESAIRPGASRRKQIPTHVGHPEQRQGEYALRFSQAGTDREARVRRQSELAEGPRRTPRVFARGSCRVPNSIRSLAAVKPDPESIGRHAGRDLRKLAVELADQVRGLPRLRTTGARRGPELLCAGALREEEDLEQIRGEGDVLVFCVRHVQLTHRRGRTEMGARSSRCVVAAVSWHCGRDHTQQLTALSAGAQRKQH
jgi:hypothetical protein